MSYYNIHKLILGSMVVASKYNEDCYFYSLKYYAKIGGVKKSEIDEPFGKRKRKLIK